jgi:hypothetical protein
MKIIEKTCYSRLLYLQTRGVDFKRAVKETAILKGPDFNGEGFNGYIECEVVFEIEQLDVFTKIWLEWYVLPDTVRTKYYNMALGK